MLFWAAPDPDILGAERAWPRPAGQLPSRTRRADNAIAYNPPFGALTAGGTPVLGRDVLNAGPSLAGAPSPVEPPPNQSQCREWSAMIGWDQKIWAIIAA